MLRVSGSSTLSGFVLPALIGLAYFAAAALSLGSTHGTGGIATIWPASGILLAALLKAGPALRWRMLVAAAVASAAANVLAGNGIGLSLGFTVANIAGAALATSVLRRWCGHEPSFVRLGDVGRFCLASTGAAGLSAAIAWWVAPGGVAMAVSWFATDLLGMWVVTPLILTVLAARDARLGGGVAPGPARSGPEVALLLGLVAVTALAVFAQSTYPALFLPMAALLAITYRLGPPGATAGVLMIATVGSVLTGMGHGPLLLLRGTGAAGAVFFLQFYFVTLLATALPLGALLAARARLLRQCADSEAMYRLLADNSNDMIVRIGLDGVRRYVSPACRAILGFEPEELVGLTPAGAIHPDDRARVMDACRTLLLNGTEAPVCVYRQARADGVFVWLEATYTLVVDPESRAPVEFIASVRDVSQRRAAELAVAEAAARMQEGFRLLSMAERAAHVGHWRLDTVAGAILWSDEVFRIHGLEGLQAPVLETAINAYHPDDRAMVTASIQRSIEERIGFEFEARIVRPGGEIRHVVSRGQPETAPDGSMLAIFGIIQDVTRQNEVEQQLTQARVLAEDATRRAMAMAETDDLTGVANRRRSLNALQEAIGGATQDGTALSIAVFDIDHFKRVNDVFGHGVGDDVLRLVAKAATAAVRPTDLVGRIGGEEFVVLLPGADTGLAILIAERLRQAIETASSDDARLPNVTASIGITSLSGAMTATGLLNKADGALYDAKAAGRNTLRLAA